MFRNGIVHFKLKKKKMKEYLEQLAGAADLISHPSDLSLSGTFF